MKAKASQFNPKLPLSRTHACVRGFAVQTVESVTKDSSAQCSPVPDSVTLDTAAAQQQECTREQSDFRNAGTKFSGGRVASK